MQSLAPGQISLGGCIGQRMEQCIAQRIAPQDIDCLVTPFRIRNDGPDKFRGEFWGKWFTALVLAWTYTPTSELQQKMQQAITAIIETQDEHGCIATHRAAHQHGHWDTWSRKYVLLGLINYYQVSADPVALQAAEKMLQHFMTQVGPDGVNLSNTGHWAWEGLAPNSILEPIALLARITGNDSYRDFAEELVARWNEPSDYLERGLRLLDAALEGTPARQVGNHKAYEQMSCFEGLCELYRLTENQSYLDAALALAESIKQTELTVAGSGSNHECWCDGAHYQTEVLEQPQETCVTVTWIKLCFKLLQLTGDPQWADHMELALHNALSASVTPDGSWWSYYSPLIGERVASHYQFEEIGLSCCVASGPRALLLSHRWAVMQDDAGIFVNAYAPMDARVLLKSGQELRLQQETDYPRDAQVRITLDCAEPVTCQLRLRIPAWSHNSSVKVNDEAQACSPGTYCCIDRSWQDGDVITLQLDMRTRAIPAASGAPAFALQRGPLLLALDNRLEAGRRESLRLSRDAEGFVQDQPCSSDDERIYFACQVPCTYHKVHIVTEEHQLILCDYASAGNAWSGDNLFRVWLPQPLFMEHAYVPDTWKLMYPEDGQRPDVPAARNDFEL